LRSFALLAAGLLRESAAEGASSSAARVTLRGAARREEEETAAGILPPAPARTCPLGAAMLGSDLLGDLIANVSADSPEGCCSACGATSACQGFSYSEQERQCYLWSELTGVQPKPGLLARVGVSYGELPRNQDLAGDVINTSLASSVLDCSGFCSASTTCEGFAYSASSGQCQLKANLSGTFPNEGVIARMKGPATAACSRYGEPQPRKGLAGELIATKFALTPSQCCSHCSALSGCEGFSYSNELQQCYLKAKLSGTFANPASVVRVVQ
jgi:hypothetical protein